MEDLPQSGQHAFTLREEFKHEMWLHDTVAVVDGQGERKVVDLA